jgi:hypothetical protein
VAERAVSCTDRVTRGAEPTHLFWAMKGPAATRAVSKLAEHARAEEWSYKRFAEALLSTEISSREFSGGGLRIRVARVRPKRRDLTVQSDSGEVLPKRFHNPEPGDAVATRGLRKCPICRDLSSGRSRTRTWDLFLIREAL